MCVVADTDVREIRIAYGQEEEAHDTPVTVSNVCALFRFSSIDVPPGDL